MLGRFPYLYLGRQGMGCVNVRIRLERAHRRCVRKHSAVIGSGELGKLTRSYSSGKPGRRRDGSSELPTQGLHPDLPICTKHETPRST